MSGRARLLLITMLVSLASALSGCGGVGTRDIGTPVRSDDAVALHLLLAPSVDSDPTAGEAGAQPRRAGRNASEAESAGSPATPVDTTTNRPPRRTDGSTGSSGSRLLSGDTDSGEGPPSEVSAPSETDNGAETIPDGIRLAGLPRNNPEAADLLDHWGHRRSGTLAEGLDLYSPVSDGDADYLGTLRTAVQEDGVAVTPDLRDGDEVEVLGARGGVTYGRWAGGPADTLSIEFDVSRVRQDLRDDPGFEATLERAGKAWSSRIADTWTTWKRSAGDLKGWLAGSQSSTEVRVGEDGETSTGLEIHVTVEHLPVGAGLGGPGLRQPGESWEPHFGKLAIDEEHLREAGEATLFSTVAHEVGHVLGSWMGDIDGHDTYTDTAAGTWSGLHVVAEHGGSAPFQDTSVKHARLGTEPDPLESPYDFAHSGVCASLMAYCNDDQALPAFLPHAIDFAFLADLGLTIAEETDRPETYGLAGWTDYAAFTLSLSRELEIALADPQPHYDSPVNRWNKLDVVDLLRVEADVFGHRTVSTLGAHLSGTARYAGGLIGAALDRSGLPPVTGDASLALDLGTLDGTASFTSLLVYPDGFPEPFAGGTLHYPFGLSNGAVVGNGAGLTLQAEFYGPGHEEVAGLIHDPRAGLLGSFGAAADDRPARENVIAAADYMYGLAFRQGATLEAENGWYYYRCESVSACESSRDGANDWTATTSEQVLAATAAWAWRDTSRPVSDRGFARIARLTTSDTDGGQGRYAMDAYAATMEHAAFGIGFERYTDDWVDADGTPPGFGNRWVGFQGSLANGLPGGVARWSGPMLGYQAAHDAGDDPFVEGLATVKFSLANNQVDVEISEVTSRDRQRTVDDFSYLELPVQTDGTFSGFRSGSIEGGFFGSSQEEAAGWFYYNPYHVAGSFGARRLPDAVTLGQSGSFGLLESSDGSWFYAYDDWGLWATQFDEHVFGAFIEQTTRKVDQTIYYESTQGRIAGTPSGSNPLPGTAVWSGEVRAFDTNSADLWEPVAGDARLRVNFATATVDADFTDFEGGHRDMSWRSLLLSSGAFSGVQGAATIEGAFYGSDHQGAAGTFSRDRLQGVFGAVRD
ncbi:MAG: hypothetical protein OXP66_11800 [Candidatus Tectomicrobia bacterium]|nr:hypothetical protein [Candidatus Tectomicrobia bacterium]